MIIEEKDFRLESVDDSSPFFDLDLLKTIKPRGKETRQEFKNVAYGITIENAIKRIAQYRISNNHKDEAITLQTYFNEFKEEIKNLTNLYEKVN